jgi:hypothetical protein
MNWLRVANGPSLAYFQSQPYQLEEKGQDVASKDNLCRISFTIFKSSNLNAKCTLCALSSQLGA